MRTIKSGLIGIGGIAHYKHMPALKKLGLVEIVTFCDIVKERAENGASNLTKIPGD